MRIIAGQWKGRRLKTPKGRGIRPTTDRVREAWMSALGSALADARVLDLYAGSGALGLEALSRGARSVVFVERARAAVRCVRANVEMLDAGDACRIIHGDVSGYVARLEPGAFDLALADPPYDRGLATQLIEVFLAVPFASELWVEHRRSERVPEAPGLGHRTYGDTMLSSLSAV